MQETKEIILKMFLRFNKAGWFPIRSTLNFSYEIFDHNLLFSKETTPNSLALNQFFPIYIFYRALHLKINLLKCYGHSSLLTRSLNISLPRKNSNGESSP